MTQPSIVDVFGAGATQTATSITIQKSDLPFTATSSNNGEQVLAAILKKAATTLTTANYGTNIDQSITVSPGFDQLVYRTVNGTAASFLQNQLTVNFVKAQATQGITPDDY